MSWDDCECDSQRQTLLVGHHRLGQQCHVPHRGCQNETRSAPSGPPTDNKSVIIDWVDSVTHHTEDVKTRQDRLRQVHLQTTSRSPSTGSTVSRTTQRMSKRDKIGSVRSTYRQHVNYTTTTALTNTSFTLILNNIF